MISDTVFYVLVADQKKALLKRLDLVKACALASKPKQVQDHVINSTISHLAATFGIQMQELENRRGCYILTNGLTDLDEKVLEWSERESAQMGITLAILATIQMSNGKVTDEVLFKFLKTLGLQEEDKSKKGGGAVGMDPELMDLFEGDAKKFVNEVLVSRQHYLKRDRLQTQDPEVEAYEYSWGDRAEAELKKSSVFRFVCEVYDEEPRMFKEQYERVKEQEGLDDETFFQ